MRSYRCTVCGSTVFFEDLSCVTCGSPLAFDRSTAELTARTDLPLCARRDLLGCNWTAGPTDELCSGCGLTRRHPDIGDEAGVAAWAATEAAKRELLCQLDRLGLPTTSRQADPGQGLAFDLLTSTDGPVTTGHADGVITIDLAEGFDPHREALRIQLAEPYRTVLGHLRHEIGHWYWNVLIRDTDRLDAFRARFGDERIDYSQALEEHYGKPDDGTWVGTHVSRYAASHPWEDWAETFAHYLHMQDALDTATNFRLSVDGPAAAPGTQVGDTGTDFDAAVSAWMALTIALNAMNRSMGGHDLYPFALTPDVIDKLRMVDTVVTAQ